MSKVSTATPDAVSIDRAALIDLLKQALPSATYTSAKLLLEHGGEAEIVFLREMLADARNLAGVLQAFIDTGNNAALGEHCAGLYRGCADPQLKPTLFTQLIDIVRVAPASAAAGELPGMLLAELSTQGAPRLRPGMVAYNVPSQDGMSSPETVMYAALCRTVPALVPPLVEVLAGLDHMAEATTAVPLLSVLTLAGPVAYGKDTTEQLARWTKAAIDVTRNEACAALASTCKGTGDQLALKTLYGIAETCEVQSRRLLVIAGIRGIKAVEQ